MSKKRDLHDSPNHLDSLLVEKDIQVTYQLTVHYVPVVDTLIQQSTQQTSKSVLVLICDSVSGLCLYQNIYQLV